MYFNPFKGKFHPETHQKRWYGKLCDASTKTGANHVISGVFSGTFVRQQGSYSGVYEDKKQQTKKKALSGRDNN